MTITVAVTVTVTVTITVIITVRITVKTTVIHYSHIVHLIPELICKKVLKFA